MSNCKICNEDYKNVNLDSNFSIERCEFCGFINRKIENSNENVREKAFGGNSIFDKFRLLLTYNRLKSLLPKNMMCNILEIGFGDGKLLRKFFNKGNSIAGIDPDWLKLKIDEKVYNYGDLYKDIKDADFKYKSFNLIYLVHTIEHIDDFDYILQKCYDWLSPNANSYGLKIFGKHWWNFEDPTHIQFFSYKSLEYALAKNNLFPIKTKPVISDSLMCEINSLLRLFNKSGKGGILSNKFIPFINLLLLPISFLSRLLFKDLSSSFEVVAKKN